MPKSTFKNISERKQNQVIDSGLLLFSKHFYEEVDVKMIVESAKIPSGSFYAYFDNIEDYYYTVIKTLQEQRIHEVTSLSKNPNLNLFDLLEKLFASDINQSLFSNNNLLIQHYFRYISTQKLGFHVSDNSSSHRPIFDVLNIYKDDFQYIEEEWNYFLEFCMNTYLFTYMKAIQDHLDLENSIQLFQNRIGIIQKGALQK